MLHYSITPKNLGAHLLSVNISTPSCGKTLTTRLPKWIAGSYKIRDYSRFIQCFQANDSTGKPLNWRKIDGDTWLIDTPDEGDITINYEVYAYDLSVRGAYLDDTRLFFNHCCVALDIIEYSRDPRKIIINTIEGWRTFTALPHIEGNLYRADNYDQQIDCPVESAERYQIGDFTLEGIHHEIVFTGHTDEDYDIESMTKHIKNICCAEMWLFGGSPLDKYLFLNYIEPKQFGGLEHKNSVAQAASPEMLMKKGKPMTEHMVNFLGLCSHEYFHLWNVKRLQPKDFKPYDFTREQHTEMMWFFEGFTSYYDELFLLRAGVVEAPAFLRRQAENLSRVLAVPGRLKLPLAASSFDAWTKLYLADANSPNNMISYYSKGAVFALYMDLFIRYHSAGKYSTDDVMRYLWENFGKKGIGINEDDVFAICAHLVPEQQRIALTETFVEGLHGTRDLPIQDLLPHFGVDYKSLPPQTANRLHTSDSGIRLSPEGKITFLNADSHAASVGVSVEDMIIAINRQDRHTSDFASLLNFGEVGESRQLTLSRRGRVFEKTIELGLPERNRILFTQIDNNSLGENWLATREM